jgi:nickel transport protein
MKALFAALAVAVSTTAALAHQLNVFAYVEDGVVIVESRFSNGNLPQIGEVSVLDGQGEPLMLLPLESDGTVRFALDPAHSDAGLLIEVRTGEGHDNYWILTPEDIARGSGS